MPKRTTIILEDDVYNMLVEESIRIYGNTRSLSKLVNELLRKAFRDRVEAEFRELLGSEKVARVTAKELEELRRELSRRLEA